MSLLYNTWTEFFKAHGKEEGPFCELLSSHIAPFNDVTKTRLGDPNELWLSIASNKFNFILATRDQ
jgi:hypothetical protein